MVFKMLQLSPVWVRRNLERRGTWPPPKVAAVIYCHDVIEVDRPGITANGDWYRTGEEGRSDSGLYLWKLEFHITFQTVTTIRVMTRGH